MKPYQENVGVETRECFVRSTENNTHMTFRWVHPSEASMSQLSGSTGLMGFTGSKRGTAYAAEELTRHLVGQVLEQRQRQTLSTPVSVHVVLSGHGKARRSVPKMRMDLGLAVVTLSDATPRPHNGCRPKKPRRV